MDAARSLRDDLPSPNRQNPAVSLPPELLVQIFALVLRSWAGAALPHQVTIWQMKRIRQGRLNLAAVCRRWRDVAVSAQSLWGVIMISSTKKAGFNRDLFTKEIIHSGDSLLSLFITYPLVLPRNVPPETMADYVEGADAAQQVLLRCKDIIFHGNHLLVNRLLNPINAIPMINLKSLSVNSSLTATLPHIDIIDLSTAVALQDLRLYFSGFEYPIRLKVSPDASFRCLEVSSPVVPRDIVDILAHSPSLEGFTWTALAATPTHSFQIPLPQMPYLRQLALYGEMPLSMLDAFHAPQVMILEINYRGPNHSEAPSIPFPKIASILFPNLRVLYIDGYRRVIRNYEPTLIDFLRTHRTLQVISLSEHITEPLAEALYSLPALGHLSTGNDENNNTHALPLIRKWHAKLNSTPGWRPPTLYLDDVYYPNLWDSDELKREPELLEFARQIALDNTILIQQETPAYWDDVLDNMAFGTPTVT
ncbi:hypothetical protein DL93DRAFT_2170362 [Clavulina sp. PMI_390]|nr:hypothetical protein DL93DRAFT_2170362 [Clavulina sp. PMI_390]